MRNIARAVDFCPGHARAPFPSINVRTRAITAFSLITLAGALALCILTGDIVWVIGPFPCGDRPDIEIFRFALKPMLGDCERVEADDGYVGEDPLNIKVPGSPQSC